MEDQGDAAATDGGGGAGGGDAVEANDTGFSNRRLHNYPLIKVTLFGEP
jgi:hypothetical protein